MILQRLLPYNIGNVIMRGFGEDERFDILCVLVNGKDIFQVGRATRLQVAAFGV